MLSVTQPLSADLLAGSLTTSLDASVKGLVVQPAWIDAGDSYWYDGRQIPLYRATDQLTLNVRTRSIVSTLPGLEVEEWLDADQLIVPIANQLDDALAALDGASGVDWVAPSFINGETGQRQWITDEVVVSIKPGVDPGAIFDTGLFSGYRPLLGTADQFIGTLFEGGLATLSVANALRDDPGVAWSAPDFFSDIRTMSVPNDPLFSTQWHLQNTGLNGALAGADVNAPAAWDTTTGSSSVVVAIVDSGVQLSHPDLSANIFVNTLEVPGNLIDDDGNGWVDDVNGWDFYQNDNNPNPAAGAGDNHGTPVAGVAAASGNNGLGVTGASQHSLILPVKISDNGVFASNASLASAIYYAAGRTANGLGTWRGADVINCSWGGGSPDATLTAAFDWAAASGRGGKGVPVFVATGNSASGYGGFSLSGVFPGTWIFEWRYQKDSSLSVGADTVYLGNVRFPDGSAERFDAAGLPTGWSTSGSASWTVVDDPSRAYGTGRYEAKAGTISDNQTTTLRSKSISVGVTGTLSFSAWVSSESGFDVMNLYASNDGGSSFFGPFFGASGVPSTTSSVSYPASLASTIAVGASSDFDYRSDYSQYGSAIDFVASSSGGYQRVVTTDRTGVDGYAAGDYTSIGSDGFGGTSSASPLAAGVGALLLSADPNLTAAQVRSIMRSTADKIGGNNGATAYDGSGFNQYYGYGRIDAAAALAAVLPSSVTARHLFYNRSSFDGDNASINTSDDLAIAIDKTAYLPGDGLAVFDNLSSYSRGINGIMIDLAGGGSHSSISLSTLANDFVFKVGNNNTPSSWAAAPTPSAVSVRTNFDGSGTDRVEITWTDGDIKNQWLEVQVLPTSRTGLTSTDVFFWGNKVGDIGSPTATSFTTTASGDALPIVAGGLGPAGGITNVRDIDRSGVITAAGDRGAAISNIGIITRIDIGTGGPFAPGGGDVGLASALAGASGGAPLPVSHRLPVADFVLLDESKAIGRGTEACFAQLAAVDMLSSPLTLVDETGELDALFESLAVNRSRRE